MSDSDSKSNLTRRDFVKTSGVEGAAAGGVGPGFFGYAAGKDPTYEPGPPTSRPDARVENIFERRGRLMRQSFTGRGEGTSEAATDAKPELPELPELLRSYYDQHPTDLELDRLFVDEILPERPADGEEYGDQYLLAEAWSEAMGAVGPDPVRGTPEENDFPRRRDGTPMEPVKLKDPARTAELIKTIAHQCGSTLVGITELNPDDRLTVPQHWKYAVVVGTPLPWDRIDANPTDGTSDDEYSRSRIIATRVAAFIKALGYPARTHIPGNSYDLTVPPVALDAGLGEQSRHGGMIAPEVGSNIRSAVVTTSIPMKTDKAIDFGVPDFCAHRKVCPSCRLCIAACPYARKSNWLHRTALRVNANDPTGIPERALASMQESYYPGPDPEYYCMPSLGGETASYRELPWWLRTEDFIHLE